MKQIMTIGPVLAKNVFELHDVDAEGQEVLRKSILRHKLLEVFAGLAPCVVGMESCGGAHNWARELHKLGHEARLMVRK